jgi:hypothetical protein
MQHFSSWAECFPGLIWSINLPPSRLRIHNQWTVPDLDLPRLLKDTRYRKKTVEREDYQLVMEFWDMAAARLPAAVIFRIRAGMRGALLLQGWPGPDSKSYCGLLTSAMIPIHNTAEALSSTCYMALGSAGYPVFAIDLAIQAIVANNAAAKELFGLTAAAENGALPLEHIAPAGHGQRLLEACNRALRDDVWAGTLSFRNAQSMIFNANVRLTPFGYATGRAVRVALLKIPENNPSPSLQDSQLERSIQNSRLPLRKGLESLFRKYENEVDGLMFSDIQAASGRVVVYGVGPAFRQLGWGKEHAYEGTIAQEIERFGLRSMAVEETLDSIKSIDWVLFTPHGVRSYFAKPFYMNETLHAVLILASLKPEAFGSDTEQRFHKLFHPFQTLIRNWRRS